MVGAAAALALTLAAPDSSTSSPGWAAAGAFLVLVGLGVQLVGSRALPARQLLGAVAFVAAVACWRQADGGAQSGLAPLVMAPALWLAAKGRRRSMWASVAAAAAALFLPILLVGAPMYPPYTLRAAGAIVSASAIAGWVVERLVSQLQVTAARSAADRQNLADAQRLAGLGSWTSNRSTGEIWWSHEMFRLVGCEPGSFVPRADSFARLVAPEDRERFSAQAFGIQPGEELRETCRVVGADGTERALLVRGMLTVDADGTERTQGTMLDVTRIVELEDQLSSTTQKMSRLLDSATGQAVIGVSAERTISMFNAGAEVLTGFSASEVLGRPLETLWPAVSEPPYEEAESSAAGRGLGQSGDRRLTRKDGARRIVHVTNTALKRADGSSDGWLKIAVDVTDARGAAEALATSEKRFRVAFDSAPCGMALLPAAGQPGAGRFVQVNQALCDLTGATEAQLLASSCLTWVVAEDHPVVFAAVARFVEGVASSGKFDCRLRRADGTVVTAQVRYANIFDAEGKGVHCVVQFDDVTARREAQRSLEAALACQEQAAERLLELDRVRADFVSMVSHELRTPLTSISGYVEMLLDGDGGDLPETALDMLGVVERNSVRLLRLIEDLLTLSRIDSESVRPVLAPVEVGRMVGGALEAVGPQAARSGVTLDVELSPAAAHSVLDADAGQIERALINVLGNAVKFTPRGGRVTLRAAVDDGTLDVAVADSGIGIGAAELDRIFERFYRSSESVKREIQGSGLGLPITRSIIEAHGGTIEASSTIGQGTVMRVRLPGTRAPVTSA
ncbi:PAS domain S-box protein [Acidiferrimicrobium sp. IK]|uniref:PAS domain S-box protein n=1 Tax=Acidiferrimicrobium sp. IK TaxID=2871700 RepID=UPI0021CB5610|nr:PAS domain S-box protein [Acidiferrimicrobium sp. IK]MCU4184541.1 PAS domain S-box protein [Acidiferrimicrobium sp. IK]